MFIYSDTREPFSGSIDFSRIDAVKQFLKHYDNSLFLLLLMSQGTVIEKAQARKEMAICERKMKFWERQDNYNRDAALAGMDKAKKLWAGSMQRVK